MTSSANQEITTPAEMMFKKAVCYAFQKRTSEAILSKLNCAKQNTASMADVCLEIDKALRENDLDWDASSHDSHAEKKYSTLFKESFDKECAETDIWLKAKGVEQIPDPRKEKDYYDCHTYDECFLSNVCPENCKGRHYYLNEFDHLLHHLVVNILRKKQFAKAGTPGQIPIWTLIKNLPNEN